jgi:26S proteasome regulatory subunit T5
MRNDEIKQSIRALDNEIRIMKSDIARIKNESTKQRAHIKDNKEKIKVHN